jgi:hypothetical protein
VVQRWLGHSSIATSEPCGHLAPGAGDSYIEVFGRNRPLGAPEHENRRTRVLEGVLTLGLRLGVLAEQVRHQIGQLTDDQEALAEREIDDAGRVVRRSPVFRRVRGSAAEVAGERRSQWAAAGDVDDPSAAVVSNDGR